MTAISNITAALVELLRATSDLVNALGAQDMISEYADDATAHRSLQEAAGAMEPGSLLVSYLGLMLTAGGWRHQIGLYFLPRDERQAQDVIKALVDGVPTDSPVALCYATVLDSLGPMEETSFARALTSEGIEYWTCTFSLAERWG